MMNEFFSWSECTPYVLPIRPTKVYNIAWHLAGLFITASTCISALALVAGILKLYFTYYLVLR